MRSTTPNINRWHAFALLAAAYFMTIVDFTIVNVSLPTIARQQLTRSRVSQLVAGARSAP
jgi:MFS family permease